MSAEANQFPNIRADELRKLEAILDLNPNLNNDFRAGFLIGAEAISKMRPSLETQREAIANDALVVMQEMITAHPIRRQELEQKFYEKHFMVPREVPDYDWTAGEKE